MSPGRQRGVRVTMVKGHEYRSWVLYTKQEWKLGSLGLVESQAPWIETC